MQKTIRALELLEKYGNTLTKPYSSPIKDGIFELRVKFSSDIVRILYFFHKGRVVVLSNGFVKKTQKTPKEEIEIAVKRKKEYERSHK